MTELVPLYDKSCKCMICNKSFTTQKMRTRFVKVLDYDTDFRPIYKDPSLNPTFYHINVCEHCGFSFSDDFTPYFPPGTKEIITDKICTNWVPHSFGLERNGKDAIKTYKLSAYCATLKNEKHITIAGMYMRLAWIYRELENMEQEQRFLKLALYEYLESYTADDFQGTQVSIDRLLYLIGEISRRTSNTEQAVKYFSKVIERQSRSLEPKIIEMARERWYDIREEQKEIKENSLSL
ncbi:DUF2225 domain-containing protein [Cytobacillus spongiae]|jgi:uncharacterized protein (DUF2225 family)|uniref:DUF2225 domain-containing protein n=1 Tax=Cytobacillus spongiae TaxID=2901381 RepID=UPI001F479F0A|nr:DUF2225 domain-containing protein [Cytobacillus spongiae]UII55401.1 DUF2225 domain-containing protein [Cytobacillus spongiae]